MVLKNFLGKKLREGWIKNLTLEEVKELVIEKKGSITASSSPRSDCKLYVIRWPNKEEKYFLIKTADGKLAYLSEYNIVSVEQKNIYKKLNPHELNALSLEEIKELVLQNGGIFSVVSDPHNVYHIKWKDDGESSYLFKNTDGRWEILSELSARILTKE